MPEHTLSDGKRWIGNLQRLGGALKYLPELEYDVARQFQEETPVDVAWLRSSDDPFPLFIFEVESRAGAQIANNAQKVFSQKTRLFEKPLFHFHVVVKGGQTSSRVEGAEEEYGKFNYRIYPAASKGSGTEMVKDILSQHRRVSDYIDIAALAQVLDAEVWPELNLDDVWLHAEACGFRVQWELAYAELAMTDMPFLRRLAQRLDSADLECALAPPTSFRTTLSRECAPLLQTAILALLRPDRAPECLGRCRDWQGIAPEARLAPRFGDAERDDLVVALVPALWAAIAAAVPGEEATAWALDQLTLMLGPPDQSIDLAFSGLSAAWILQLAKAKGELHRAAFDRAAEHVTREGGMAAGIWMEPPGLGGTMDHYDEWAARLADQAQPAPTWDGVKAPATPGPEPYPALLTTLLAALTGRRSALDGGVVLAAVWASPAEGPVAAAAELPDAT